ncbi:DUF397 domain-containing protein [Kibdelosporangium lantanae]|uniref:DUF397 domain-containing protein n=1 Tax=Kibdelosporangium lantanae TaxID=1497396 RepID=A0ABW3M412_9PSEU
MSDHTPVFPESAFRKSTFSDPDRDCVHVARRDGWVAVRDSKTRFSAGTTLVFPAERFSVLLTTLNR